MFVLEFSTHRNHILFVNLLLCIHECVCFFYFQEVGSIIGKKGEIVKRFREDVSILFKIKLIFIIISFMA